MPTETTQTKLDDYPDVLSPRLLAEILDCSEQKVYQMCRHDPKFPARKMGRAWRVWKWDLVDWMKTLKR